MFSSIFNENLPIFPRICKCIYRIVLWTQILFPLTLISCSKSTFETFTSFNPSFKSMEIKQIDTKSAVVDVEWEEIESKNFYVYILVAKSEAELDSSSAKKIVHERKEGRFHIMGLETSTEYYIKTFATYVKDTVFSKAIIHFKTLKPVVGTAVELGLSVKWANINFGAATPEGYGEHLSLDGAKNAYWGDKWRSPTNREWYELVHNCSWTWTIINGVTGYKFQSKKPNYTDKWIFLPAAGYQSNGRYFCENSCGQYWCSPYEGFYNLESTFIEYDGLGYSALTSTRSWWRSLRFVSD